MAKKDITYEIKSSKYRSLIGKDVVITMKPKGVVVLGEDWGQLRGHITRVCKPGIVVMSVTLSQKDKGPKTIKAKIPIEKIASVRLPTEGDGIAYPDNITTRI